jgi:hypothetical protein
MRRTARRMAREAGKVGLGNHPIPPVLHRRETPSLDQGLDAADTNAKAVCDIGSGQHRCPLRLRCFACFCLPPVRC